MSARPSLTAPVQPWRTWLGPLATVLVAAFARLLADTPVGLIDPAVLVLSAVVLAVAVGGVAAGLVSAVLGVVLTALLFSAPGRWLAYDPDQAARVVTLIVALPVVVLLVGKLKRGDDLRVQEEARAALRQYRDIVAELDCVVWEREPDTLRATFVSGRAQDLLGYPPEAWIVTPGFWESRIHTEDRERVIAGCREVVAARSHQVFEYRMIAADGHVVWLHDSMRVLADSHGRLRVRGVIMDMTKRHLAERALTESEARKAAILTSALDAVIDMDEHGRITGFNPAAERMFGHARADAVGKDLASLIVPPRLRDAHRKGFQHYLVTGAGAILGRRVELPALRADGTEFPVELSIISVPSSQRATTGFVRDITERKAAEQALTESERNYRLLMEQASDGILITDLGGRYLDVNPKACEMLGYPRDELLQLGLADLIPAEDLAARPLRLKEVLAGEIVLVERRLRRKDGTLLPVEISAKRLDEGRIQGIYRDITARKQAEDQLKQAMAVLSTTLDSTADGILVVDLQGKITCYNRRFAEMWGIPEQILSSGEDDRAIAVALDVLKEPDQFLRKVRELYADREAESSDVLELKDGRIFDRFSKPHRIGDASVGRVWSFRDVTASRAAERALRDREDQLRQAQKMEAVGRLAGGVAHDFNNLLTAILGHSSLLLETLPAGHPLRVSADEIQKAAERAAGLTGQLLAFSRKQMLELKVLDLNAAVDDMHSLLHRTIGENIELILVPAPGLGKVKVDPGQLQQVIMNLVLNARDAMPEGGKLVVETANVQVDESMAERHPPLQVGPYVMLAVSDTGIGMEEETRKHVFEPFFTTKERGKGTGLGLATVYGIVRQCEGYIWVYSQVGRGTTFKLYLPRVEAVRDEEVAPPKPRSTSGTETILVAEDEDVVRSLMRNTLLERGYRVLEARDGAEALRISERHQESIELLLTDVVMPGMSGRELAERIAARRRGVRVLYISGYTDDAIVRHGVLDPRVAFLQKPFTMDALARKVRETLDQVPSV